MSRITRLKRPVIALGAVLDKSGVGLGNVDNTSDANKPVSTATQTALNGKEPTIATGANTQYVRGDKTLATLNKSAVGLANVDNTTDANKPVSSATQTALDGKVDESLAVAKGDILVATGSGVFVRLPVGGSAGQVILTDSGEASGLRWATPTKSTVGLGNVDNTSDATKRLARVTTVTSSATPTFNTDTCDALTITAQTVPITSMTSGRTGTLSNFQRLLVRIFSVSAQAITWGSDYVAGSVALPTTTVGGKVLVVGFIVDESGKLACEAVGSRA